jgi:hypothetical protein
MSHHERAVTAVSGWKGGIGVEKLKQLLGVSLLTIGVAGCGAPRSLDVVVYDACIARHPQEVTLCEGPRQAYQLDPAAFQATAAAFSPVGR